MNENDILATMEAIATTNVDAVPGGMVYREGPFHHLHQIALGTSKLAPANHYLTKKYCDLLWDALNDFGKYIP